MKGHYVVGLTPPFADTPGYGLRIRRFRCDVWISPTR
jgi:hypothetical protein